MKGEMKMKGNVRQKTRNGGQRPGHRTIGLRVGAVVLCPLSLVLSAAAVTEQPVTEVGVTRITSSVRSTLVAVSYDEMDGSSGMSVSNFVSAADLDVGDLLAVFRAGKYDTWQLEEVDGVKRWARNEVTYTFGADGTLVKGEGAPETTVRPVGSGILLVRNPNWDGKEFSFCIYGRPVKSPVLPLQPGTWTIAGNPGQKAAAPTVENAVVGDTIIIYIGNTPLNVTYKLKGGEAVWRYMDNMGRFQSGLPDVAAGCGFWYVAVEGGDGRRIKW